MSIKLIIFDLDGVLIDAKKIHFEALNRALNDPKYQISWEEHLSRYDGLKTKQKLEMLASEKGLPQYKFDQVWRQKQVLTHEMLKQTQPQQALIDCMAKLTSRGYTLACCSNSIRSTVDLVLQKLQIHQYFSIIKSNQDVINSKPHPEIYWNAISEAQVSPDQVLIVEDSPHGLHAASQASKCVVRVSSPSEVTYEYIMQHISSKQHTSNLIWTDDQLNVLIPMAGAGSRFEQAGYTFPKPLIEVNGKPMIQLVVENLAVKAHFIFVVQKEHRVKYNLDTLLPLIAPGCTIIDVDGITQGAACTALLAKHLINSNRPLLFANSDQFVEWSSTEFLYKMQESQVDGGIVTFSSIHPRWSFAEVGSNGFVQRVAEKDPISNNATTGYYYWKHGSDFVKYAERMIEQNQTVNGEFYVCPVYNQAIQDGKLISIHEATKMWGLGTPEDLQYYLEHHKQ